MRVNLKPGETSHDSLVRGLHLRCLVSGRRSWFVYYRTKDGTERRPKIGEYPVVGLSEARRRAKNILGQVAVGLDPKGEWDALKEQPRMDELFTILCREHWGRERYRKTGRDQEVRKLWLAYLQPRFGSRKPSGITKADVETWHTQLEGTPFAANRALEVLKKLLSFAQQRGLIDRNPAAPVSRFPEPARSRVATVHELRRLGIVLATKRESHFREWAFTMLVMTTGARPESVPKLKSSDIRVTPDGSGYVLFEGKSTHATGQPEALCIPAVTMREVVRHLPAREDGLLIGPVKYRHFWDVVRREAGCPDLWMRDFRRTFASYGLSMGYELGLIGEVLNHRSASSTKRYTRLLPQKRIAATNAIAASLTEQPA